MGVGVVPNTYFVKGVVNLGLRNRIVVNDKMQTSNPDIYTSGDCIEFISVIDEAIRLFPIWLNAMGTGKIAGASIAGCNVSCDGGIKVNSLTVFDKVYFSIGYVCDEIKLAKRVERDDVTELYYFDERWITGAEIINHVEYAGLLKHIIKKGLKFT
jgi:NADPH-dependent 2,4-dienoyl-CoA reductase/sulfur reductase-like enzyme